MSDNPKDASEEYSEEVYDLVAWNEAYGEWDPRGYILDWKSVRELYKHKLLHVPNIRHRIVLVETTVKMTDVTEQYEEKGENA